MSHENRDFFDEMMDINHDGKVTWDEEVTYFSMLEAERKLLSDNENSLFSNNLAKQKRKERNRRKRKEDERKYKEWKNTPVEKLIPEDVNDTNYKELRSKEIFNLVFCLVVYPIAICTFLLILYAAMTTKPFSMASAIVIFFDVAFFISASYGIYVIFSRAIKSLHIINDRYGNILPARERKRLRRKGVKREIIIAIVSIVAVCAAISPFAVPAIIREINYDKACKLMIEKEDVNAAREILYGKYLYTNKYKDSKSLLHYGNALIDVKNGQYNMAALSMEYVDFKHSLTKEQRNRVEALKAEINAHSSQYVPNKKTYKHASNPTQAPTTTKKKKYYSSKNNDPYDAKDYVDPDDFYYDHYDDFYDYEDAEDYYHGHN